MASSLRIFPHEVNAPGRTVKCTVTSRHTHTQHVPAMLPTHLTILPPTKKFPSGSGKVSHIGNTPGSKWPDISPSSLLIFLLSHVGNQNLLGSNCDLRGVIPSITRVVPRILEGQSARQTANLPTRPARQDESAAETPPAGICHARQGSGTAKSTAGRMVGSLIKRRWRLAARSRNPGLICREQGRKTSQKGKKRPRRNFPGLIL